MLPLAMCKSWTAFSQAGIELIKAVFKTGVLSCEAKRMDVHCAAFSPLSHEGAKVFFSRKQNSPSVGVRDYQWYNTKSTRNWVCWEGFHTLESKTVSEMKER